MALPAAIEGGRAREAEAERYPRTPRLIEGGCARGPASREATLAHRG